MMLTLYFSPGSSAMATHIALYEVGAPFDARLTPLHQEANRTPEYLALNREGKVPTLIVDDRPPLTEVAATLWYLARRYPEAGLLPQFGDIEGEARVISWMSFIASTIHPARRVGGARWQQVFELAEQRLAGQEWTVDRYSIADIHLFRLFWRYVDSEHPGDAEFPGLIAHYRRMLARLAVQKTLQVESAIGYNLPH
jgi:glutathione S-transferase